ncbi:hypothetical protein GOBAR_AA09426 [Gossypium barbadense]|uniref:Uncharacterized protein n=1 Tax=Gossypium barbadense TaxID=3634 RepID=A0A2P5Y6L6_GOSBA|nr:hypothetical protein GOBAR_AA09426 [Gossypium barbadense]
MKRGNLSIAEYLAQIKRLCDLLLASGHTLSDKEQVHVVLVGLSIEFESMITMATFSLVPLSMARLVEICFSHLVQWCYYRHDRSYDNAQVSSLPQPLFNDAALFSHLTTATRNVSNFGYGKILLLMGDGAHAKIECVASGHTLSDKEQVHVVLVGLSIEFESMITMATFSLVPLSMARLVEMYLECENCQRRFVVETSIHANLV